MFYEIENPKNLNTGMKISTNARHTRCKLSVSTLINLTNDDFYTDTNKEKEEERKKNICRGRRTKEKKKFMTQTFISVLHKEKKIDERRKTRKVRHRNH